jgi:hypothetical protein
MTSTSLNESACSVLTVIANSSVASEASRMLCGWVRPRSSKNFTRVSCVE